MNERLKYEQLIGGKLQGLPVPDMADAIWSRIEAQLDIDLPTDDGGGGSPLTPPSGPTIIGWGLSVFIIAVVTAFFLFKNKPEKNINSKQLPGIEQTVSPKTQNNSPPLQKTNSVNKITTPAITGADNVLNNSSDDLADAALQFAVVSDG
jgi:hypothetical protein